MAAEDIDTAELIRVFGDTPVAQQKRGSSEVERTTPLATDLTIATLQAQVDLLQAQLQEARQREAWLQSLIEQRLLPPPHYSRVATVILIAARQERAAC